MGVVGEWSLAVTEYHPLVGAAYLSHIARERIVAPTAAQLSLQVRLYLRPKDWFAVTECDINREVNGDVDLKRISELLCVDGTLRVRGG